MKKLCKKQSMISSTLESYYCSCIVSCSNKCEHDVTCYPGQDYYHQTALSYSDDFVYDTALIEAGKL